MEMMVALGFREHEGGVICLPLDANTYEISARVLELEVGLDFLKKRITKNSENDSKSTKVEPTKNSSSKLESTVKSERYFYFLVIDYFKCYLFNILI